MSVSGSKRTILVIDDDQEVRNLFVRTLGLKGFEVISSASPEEAVDWAREIEPDLIFVSLLLPGSNGLKVSKAVHSQDVLKKVPIVMLITYKGELDPKYTSTIGVVDVLVKPLNEEAISSIARKILGNQQAPDEAKRGPSAIAAASGPAGLKKDAVEPDVWDLEFENAGQQENGKAPDKVEENLYPLSEQKDIGREHGPEGITDLNAQETAKETAENMEDIVINGETNIVINSTETPDPDENNEISDEPESGPGKKILTLVALILVVAAIALGAFSFRKYISPDSIALLKNRITGTGAGTVENAKVSETGQKERSAAPAAPEQENASVASIPDTKPAEFPAASQGGPAEPAGKEPAQKTITEPKAQKNTIFSVQVGFFADEKNAQFLADKMKQKGYEAYVGEGPGQKSKRVLIGKFSERKEAQELSRVLRRDGVKSIVYAY